jgi:hypothetical protein
MGNKSVEVLEEVVIKFAGDSGDGMQLTGGQFTNSAALFGNDLELSGFSGGNPCTPGNGCRRFGYQAKFRK